MTCPEISPEAEEYWEATRERRLVLQRCDDCGRTQFYPRALCVGCGATALSYVESIGQGVVYSHTTVMRSPGPPFEAPYTIALVDLDDGPRLLTRILGSAACDERVELDWLPLEDGRHLPVFRSRRP